MPGSSSALFADGKKELGVLFPSAACGKPRFKLGVLKMKLMNQAKRFGAKLQLAAVSGVSVISATNANAATSPVDFSTLTASIDFSTVITAILAIAAIMVGVYVAWKGARMVISAVRGL
jgi:hypothetical protein